MAVPAAGLVSHYSMDRISGSIINDETTQYPANIIGGLLAPDGRVRKAVQNPNISSYIDVPALGSWFGGRSEFGLSFFTKFIEDGPGTDFTFCVSYTSHTSPFYVVGIIVRADSINVRIGDNTNSISANGDFLNIRHVAINYYDSQFDIYLDGVLGASLSAPAILPNTRSNACFGRIPAVNSTSNHAYFFIDEWRLYEQPLTPAEIIEHFREGLYEIEIELLENIAVDDFLVRAHRLQDGSLSQSLILSSTGTHLLNNLPDQTPHLLTISPDIGDIWLKDSDVIVNQKCFPTNPSTTPYYFRCTIAGSTGTTEPAWQTGTPGALTTDGTAEWELVERIPQPITHGPLIPQ